MPYQEKLYQDCAGPPPPPIQFENIAGKAGLTFVLRDSATPGIRQIETMVGGVVQKYLFSKRCAAA